MISVIIPSYNRSALLPRAVRSVLSQTIQDIEVIIVDDASTDDTETVVRSMTDQRIRYIQLEHNQGACVARNIGVQAAQGEWIAFQDSDDEWMPDKLEKQYRQLQETGADIVFCAFERYKVGTPDPYVFPHAHIAPGRITYKQLLFENLISTQTILGKKSCFEKLPFRPDFPRLQDWELMLRMVQQYDIRYFNDILVRIYEQEDSISRHPEKQLAALEMLREMHYAAIQEDEQLTLQMCHSRAMARRSCGMPSAPPYFQELSLRRPLLFNVRLFLSGMKQVLLH